MINSEKNFYDYFQTILFDYNSTEKYYFLFITNH